MSVRSSNTCSPIRCPACEPGITRRQPLRTVLSVAAIHTLVVASGLMGQTCPSRCQPVAGPPLARL